MRGTPFKIQELLSTSIASSAEGEVPTDCTEHKQECRDETEPCDSCNFVLSQDLKLAPIAYVRKTGCIGCHQFLSTITRHQDKSGLATEDQDHLSGLATLE